MQDQYLRRKIIFLAAFVSLSASLQIFNDAFIYWQESLLGNSGGSGLRTGCMSAGPIIF